MIRSNQLVFGDKCAITVLFCFHVFLNRWMFVFIMLGNKTLILFRILFFFLFLSVSVGKGDSGGWVGGSN